MAKATMFVLANPTSPDRDKDFNTWYNKIHAGEVCALDGFESMKRYRATAIQPGDKNPTHRYLATYEISDLKRALKAMAEGAPNFRMTDAADLANAVVVAFEETFAYTPKKAKPKAKAKGKAKAKAKAKKAKKK